MNRHKVPKERSRMHERHSTWQVSALQLLCLLLASSCHGVHAALPPARRLANLQQDRGSSTAAAASTSKECTTMKQLQCRLTRQVCQSGACADAAAESAPTKGNPARGGQPPAGNCSKHSDCAPATPYCIRTATSSKCRANCTAGADCRGLSPPRPFCLQNTCRVQQCFHDSHCSSRQDMRNRPFCVDVAGAKRCRQCGQDSHCSRINRHWAACVTQNSTCVQCKSHQHCAVLAAAGALGRFARPDAFECKAAVCQPKPVPPANITGLCNSTADCKFGVCQRKQCVPQCASREQCVSSAKALGLSAAAATCESGRCVECSETSACPANAIFPNSTPTCQSGRCVECGADSDCAGFSTPVGSRPACELNKCVECSEQRPCPAGLFGAQGSCQDGRCIECNSTAQDACPSSAVKPGGACLAGMARCVQCTQDAHCGDNGACMPDYTCLECKVDADCAASPGVFPGAAATCQNGKCTECVADEDCGKFQYRFGPAPFCSAGRCVECSRDRPCGLGMHNANGTCQDGRCKECGADADCPKKMLAPGGICQTTPGVPSSGKCVECREAGHCKWMMTTSKALVCAPEEGSCEVCVSDQDCVGFAGLSGLGPYCDKHKCSVKGRNCSTASDCAYAGPCVGMAECPTPVCVGAQCDSGLFG